MQDVINVIRSYLGMVFLEEYRGTERHAYNYEYISLSHECPMCKKTSLRYLTSEPKQIRCTSPDCSFKVGGIPTPYDLYELFWKRVSSIEDKLTEELIESIDIDSQFFTWEDVFCF